MKSLLYRSGSSVDLFEFIIKYDDDDLEGLLNIAVEQGEIDYEHRDEILRFIEREQYLVVINHVIVFEVVDHDATGTFDDSGCDLGLPDSFET
jgi:hypothetical protein